MKIGVLGSGNVGNVLATGFLKHGYEVMIGTRSPEKLKDWAEKNPKGKTGTFDATAKFADLIVLAVKGNVAAELYARQARRTSPERLSSTPRIPLPTRRP